MPQVNHHIWELTRFHPDFIWVMFLIMMYNRFLAQFGGRNHHPMMLSISPILPQLLTIMSDTQVFPFFSKDNLLWMLTCHGATLHIVRALCGPTPNRRIMHLILGRMVSKIASNLMVVSCFERCSSALHTYPVSIPRSPLHIEISDEDIVCKLKTIWQMLWLCTVLPEAKAILDISSESLSHNQMKTYDKLYMIIIFRRLFESRNRVFILLCNYFYLQKKYEKQKRSDACSCMLRKRIREKLQLQMASHDFEVYSYYLKFLFTKLHPCELSVNLIDDSLKILEKFFQTMGLVHYRYENGSDSGFFDRQVTTSNLSDLSDLLNQNDQETLLEQLKKVPKHEETKILGGCMSPPNHSFHEWLFPVLQTTSLFNLQPKTMQYMKTISNDRENISISCGNKLKNRFARMMILVLNFAKWSQSDHPHRHFLFDCVSSMKATGTTKHADLARFLHLQSLQSKSSREFEKLFKKFRKFAHPSMEWSEPTERTLLCFFDKMHVVLSNKEFLSSLQKFLKTLENEQFFWKKVGKFESLCHSFLTSLYTNPQFHSMIEGICYFRLTNCEDCRKYLHSDNDDGLCPSCKHQRVNDEELEEYEEYEKRDRERYRERVTRGLNGW